MDTGVEELIDAGGWDREADVDGAPGRGLRHCIGWQGGAAGGCSQVDVNKEEDSMEGDAWVRESVGLGEVESGQQCECPGVVNVVDGHSKMCACL